SNGKSKVLNGAGSITISDFVSVRTAISQGMSSIACVNVERILSLLNKKTTEIYKVLDKQPVYAVGPDIQQGYSPCIACWVTKPLDISIMQQLSALFDNEFEIINHVNRNGSEDIIYSNNNKNQNENSGDGNNGDGNYGNENDYENYGDGNDEDGENSGENRNNNDENEDGEDSGEDEEDNGGDDYEDGGGNKNNSPYIRVSSEAHAKLKNEFQSFNIDTYLWANINTDKHKLDVLEFSINLFNCGVGEMLNEICQLSHGFIGYYIDFIEIRVSPLPFMSGVYQLFRLKEAYSPQNLNQENIELSAGREKNSGIQITLGAQQSSITASRNNVINRSAKRTTSKWNMDMTNCRTKGVKWSYSYTANDLNDASVHRKTVNLQLHSGCWYTTSKMKGFCITIVQVLRCELKPKPNFFSFKSKPEIIKKCPQIVHTLEVSFNDITNFNERFAKLTKNLYMDHEEITVILDENRLPSKNIQNEDSMNINRTLFPPKN
ncbi:1097_t:CDS:1, partial [Scutellospora calospora]